MSQRAFALEANVPPPTIWHLLHGTRRYLRNDTYERIRNALSRLEGGCDDASADTGATTVERPLNENNDR